MLQFVKALAIYGFVVRNVAVLASTADADNSSCSEDAGTADSPKVTFDILIVILSSVSDYFCQTRIYTPQVEIFKWLLALQLLVAALFN